MAKPIWTAIDDLLEAHDGHLELRVASKPPLALLGSTKPKAGTSWAGGRPS